MNKLFNFGKYTSIKYVPQFMILVIKIINFQDRKNTGICDPMINKNIFLIILVYLLKTK